MEVECKKDMGVVIKSKFFIVERKRMETIKSLSFTESAWFFDGDAE